MPGKNRLKKRQIEYLKAKGIFANAKKDDPFYADKLAISEALTAITEKFGVEEPLSPAVMKELAELYKDVLDKINDLTEKTEKYLDSYNGPYENRAPHKEILKQNEFLAQRLDKDLMAIEKAAAKNEEKTLNDIYETSRVNSNYDVLPDENRKASRGAQNSRIPVTLKDKTTGEEIEGFFTPDHVAMNNINLVKEAVAEAKKKWGKAADQFDSNIIESLYYEFDRAYPAMRITIMESAEELSLMPYEETYKLLTKKISSFDNKKEFVEMINTPEKMKIFLDLAKTTFLAENVHSINNRVGINIGSNINRRNSAMSEIAALLGRPNLIASSENVKINIDGKEMKGTFMKKAAGADRAREGIDSEFIRVGQESINDLQLKKTLADMQILDYICGNPDRHTGNMLYSHVRNADGSITIKTAQGIDNDSCLGTGDFDQITSLNAVRLENINVITKEMSENILSLTPSKLRQSLYGFKLSRDEVENAVGRLNKLQNKIIKDQKRYSEGYAEGYLIPNTIKVVDDKELDKLRTIEDLRLKRGEKNIFNRITAVANVEERINLVDKNAREAYIDTAYKATVEKLGKLNEIIEKINKDYKLTDKSPKYTEMKKNMEALKKMIVNFKGPIIGSKVDVSKGHVKSINQVREQMQKTIESVYDYREYKYNKKKGEEWRDAEPGHVITREERRFNHSTDALKLLSEQLETMNKLDEKLNIYNDIQDKKQVILDVGKKRDELYQNSETVKQQKKAYEDMVFQNHFSRSEFKTLQAFEQIGKAATPEDKAIAQVQFDMMLGFSVHGLRPEDKERFKQKISEHTGVEIKVSDEALLKKAVASHLVLSKNECQKINEKDRSFDEDKIVKNLASLDIKDPVRAVNVLLNNKAYDKFINSSKDLLNTHGCEVMPTVAIPNIAKTMILSNNLVDAVKREQRRQNEKNLENGQPKL